MKVIIFIFFVFFSISTDGQTNAVNKRLQPFIIRIVNEHITGSGFVAGKYKDSIYIITTRHVIQMITDLHKIPIDMGDNLSRIIYGKVVYVGSDTDDVAVVSVRHPQFKFTPFKYTTHLDVNSDLCFIRSFDGKNILPDGLKSTLKSKNDVLHRYQLFMSMVNSGDSGAPVFERDSSSVIGIILAGGYPVIVFQAARIKELLSKRFERQIQFNKN